MEKEALNELIKQVKTKEDTSFESLYYLSIPYLKGYLWKLGINYCDMDDLIQEVFIEVFKSIDKLQDANCYYTWLYTVARSKFYRFQSKFYKYHTVELEVNMFSETNKEFLPEEVFASNERAGQVEQIFEQLTQEQAQIVKLRYLKEMSMREIAEHCTIPIGTVKSRLFQARHQWIP